MTDATADTTDAQAIFGGTREVDPRYVLDEAALGRWLADNVEDYAGPLTVRQFKGGQSNPTYELVTPGRSYVLRRKPPGVLLPLGPRRGPRVHRHFRHVQTEIPRRQTLCSVYG